MIAAPFADASRSLESARQHAGLSHAELAAKLGTTELRVADLETGLWHVSEAYALSVLRACGLPDDWKATP